MDPAFALNVSDLLARLQTIPDQRKRRGVRYPLAVLLVIAILARLCGHSQVHSLAVNSRPGVVLRHLS